jgi:hypothetical protein
MTAENARRLAEIVRSNDGDSNETEPSEPDPAGT